MALDLPALLSFSVSPRRQAQGGRRASGRNLALSYRGVAGLGHRRRGACA